MKIIVNTMVKNWQATDIMNLIISETSINHLIFFINIVHHNLPSSKF